MTRPLPGAEIEITMDLSAVLLAACMITASSPLTLLPENPHYFLFRGKPTVLLTSGEHYGAVLNRQFDFVPYLAELEARGFNLTRTFSGTYREVPGSFKIQGNTLAPEPGRYQSPWMLRDGKYDLDEIDPEYLARLRRFMTEAGRRGIVVEFVLFCPFYEENLWSVNPMNGRNNRNGVGHCPRDEAYTLKHPDLLRRQVALVTRLVTELNAFDNLYFEICNEPYFGGVTLDWQRKISEAIAAAEEDLPNKHLIAQNIANGSARITNPDPWVSIFNFHYASPPDAVRENAALRKPIAFDETGFKGTSDAVYSRQAWQFLMAGGAVFSNLDYSFTAERPTGAARVSDPTPGGGGPSLRRQLSVLKKIFDGLDLAHTVADSSFHDRLEGNTTQIMGMSDRKHGIYLLYVSSGRMPAITLNLPARSYRLEWIDPSSGKTLKTSDLGTREGTRPQLECPDFHDDIIVRIVEQNRNPSQ